MKRMTTGALPADGKSAVWKNPSLVDGFLKRVRKGVPLSQIQLDVMMRVIAGPEADQAQGERPVHNFLDLGCGDGILAAAILEKYPRARGTLVDFSTPMLQAALSNLEAYSKSLHVSSADYTDPSWFDIISAHAPFDAVVSGFSIHHQPDSVKRQVYVDVFDLLVQGGVFVNIEHVSSATPRIEALYDDYFIDTLWASQLTEGEGQTRDQVAAAYHSREDKQANILASVELQCEWLREIGFDDVDCYFRIFELAVFGGRRPLTMDEDVEYAA
ncbi:MAG: class I SAM-dependent methyltransferase [Caldilineaceae bacterium]|nr:class I SAM-dependent methyltransferase [Caldilineaceae bacterium]